LLTVFFATHDPTTLNRQGNDVGTQYRSAIFYANDEQKRDAEDLIKELAEVGTFGKPIVTSLEPLSDFYEAEGYHQKYYASNPYQPYCQVMIPPKLNKLHKQFTDLLKSHGKDSN
jgi:peptide-methionine (S)-S-oxide reductase